MQKVLIPVDGSRNADFALRHVITRFMNNTAMQVHLLNVQTPLTAHVGQYLSRKSKHDYYLDCADKALAPARAMLDRFGIPYSVHREVGDRATCITDAAKRLRCDQIVIATARKNSLTRLIEESTTNRVLELTSLPVEVIAGDAVSNLERYGIPAAVAALIAFFIAAD